MASYMNHFNTEYFFHQTSELIIIQSVNNRRAKYYFSELLSEYLKSFNDMKHELNDIYNGYQPDHDYCNVIFIDSYESFRKINTGPKTKTQDINEYYLIVYYPVNRNPEKEIQKIFNYFWHYYTVNVALLLQTHEEGPILLYTYYPFTPKLCHNAQLHIINQNKTILDLKASELFPEKFRNFHNCTLMAALWNVPPYLTLPEKGRGLDKIKGIEGLLLNTLAKYLQFKIDYIVPPNNEQRGLIEADGTLTGAIKMLSDRTADLSLGSFRCTLERSLALSPTYTFYQTTQVFTVLSIREPWTSLEIIAYPFAFNIWIVLLVLILALLSSSHILEYIFQSGLKFIFGFTSAYFININIIAITLGQTAQLMPQRNFARYVLLMWILLTMILRSIYQGSLYDFLKSQKTLALPDTTRELTERKYKLILNVATSDSFSNVPIIRDKLIEVIIMNMSDVGGFPILEANPDKSYVIGAPKDFVTYYVNTNKKNGVFHILRESVFSQQLCMYFTKHSYLMETFDKIIQNLRNFGLIDHWAISILDERFLEKLDQVTVEKPLTFAQLSGIIQICFFLYFLTIIVFIGEILWFKYHNKNQ